MRAINKQSNNLAFAKSLPIYAVPKSTIGNIINCSYDSVKLRIIHEMCQGMEIGINTFFASPLFKEDNLEPQDLRRASPEVLLSEFWRQLLWVFSFGFVMVGRSFLLIGIEKGQSIFSTVLSDWLCNCKMLFFIKLLNISVIFKLTIFKSLL